MTSIHPYLIFNGNCEEAFNFYKSAFGGEFTLLSRFKDGPSQPSVSPDESEKIMHVALPIGSGGVLMGSDSPQAMGAAVLGSNFFISINVESKAEADRLFQALSAEGQVAMPLQKTFWGAYFGMFNDKFGVRWMVSYADKQA